jgi:hypothetical protein
MRHKIFAFVMTAVLLGSILSGCGQTQPTPDLLIAVDITSSNGEKVKETYAQDVNHVIKHQPGAVYATILTFGQGVQTSYPRTKVELSSEVVAKLRSVPLLTPYQAPKTYWAPMLRKVITALKNGTQPMIVMIQTDGECHDKDEVKELVIQLAALPNLKALWIGPVMSDKWTNWYDVHATLFAPLAQQGKLFLSTRDAHGPAFKTFEEKISS